MGITITLPGDFKCTSCQLAKLRIKNFGTGSEPTTSLGERVSIDISGVRTTSYGGAKFWLLLQDHYTDYIWSFFLSAKSELPTVLYNWVKDFQKTYGTTIKTIRCDNAGENKSLRKKYIKILR